MNYTNFKIAKVVFQQNSSNLYEYFIQKGKEENIKIGDVVVVKAGTGISVVRVVDIVDYYKQTKASKFLITGISKEMLDYSDVLEMEYLATKLEENKVKQEVLDKYKELAGEDEKQKAMYNRMVNLAKRNGLMEVLIDRDQ